ncbi:MAG: NAD(P)-binding domain-containing protein [Arenicellales bacterium]|nr:NAD(P)-binding domain-containing protein [Arenicellales bacterium]
MDRNEKTGFIGLGSMGEGMALNLARKQFSLVLYDTRSDQYRGFSEFGSVSVGSPSEVMRKAATVLTVLPGPKEVEEVILGADGLLDHAVAGDVIMDLSTVLPDTSDRLAAACAAKGVSFVDAPIGRLAQHAWEGTSMFMVGAHKKDFVKIKSQLEAMGTTIVHCGAPGTGTRTKLCNNFLAIGSCMLNAEFVALTQGFGLDLTTTLEVIHGTTATNGQLKINYASKVFQGDIEPGFQIDLAHKDLSLILNAAAEMQVPLPIGAVIRESVSAAKADGWGKKDFSGLADYWCERAHVDKARIETDGQKI